MSNHHRANAFEPTLSSGLWEGLSYRQGCEGLDETRWTQTSLVFTDIRKGGRLTPRGEAPAWGREEPGSAIFKLCGKGISHWRGRQIHFALRGFVEPGGGGDQHLRITLIKRHNGSFHNIVHYGGQSDLVDAELCIHDLDVSLVGRCICLLSISLSRGMCVAACPRERAFNSTKDTRRRCSRKKWQKTGFPFISSQTVQGSICCVMEDRKEVIL